MDREPRLTTPQRVAPFAEAVARGNVPVDELALLVASAMNPRVDVLGSLADLDELAAMCPTPTRDGVLQFLFAGVSPHLRGDTSDYHHWRNSSLDQVISRGAGMPLTLAIVAIAVAQRVGVHLVGVGMPGHFLVGDPSDSNWFADPFAGTVGIDRAGCRHLAVTLGHTIWSESSLAPIPTRLIIARLLNNLRATCDQRNDMVRLAIIMQLRQALPEFAAESEAARQALAIFN